MRADTATPMVSARRSVRPRTWYAIFSVALGVSLLFSVSIGSAGPDWWRVPLELLNRLPLISVDSGVTEIQWQIIWNIRMPRVLLGALVGGVLSIAGASYQGVFRNPLVDPYLLGAAAGAGLGATFVFTIGREATEAWPIDPVLVASFVAALATVTVTYLVGGAV